MPRGRTEIEEFRDEETPQASRTTSPEGEGRRKGNHPANRPVRTASNPQRRIKDSNPALTETGWKCDSSHHPCLRRGATGVVGRGGAADPHGRTERSGVTSSRPTVGRSRGTTFACDGPAWPGLGRAVKTVKPRGLAPAALHSIHARRYPFLGPETHTLWVRDVHAAGPTRDVPPPRIGPSRAGASQSKLLPVRHTVPTGRCRGSRGAAVIRGPTRGRTHALVGTSWWLPAVTPGRHTATPGGSSRCGWVSTASLGTYRRTGDCSMRVLPDCRPPGRPFERNGTTPPTRRRFGPTGPRSRRRTS